MSTTTKKLTEAIKAASKPATKGYDTSAVVRRIEGNTAWVHIPGGVDETPVKLTIAAEPGDAVQVRVSGGSAWIVGNVSAPPTDDKTAKRAEIIANDAKGLAGIVKTIATKAAKVAANAFKIAGNTNQYFWHTESGTDTGAHITEIPQEEFLADPDNGGGNLLARSNGIAVRDGLTELAQFSAEGERFQNESGFSMLEVARKENGLYIGDVQWFDYNSEDEFVMEWGIHYITSILGYDKYDVLVYTMPQAEYSYDGNVITLTASGKANLIAAHTAFVKVTYTASGRFPFFTLGNRRLSKRFGVGNYSTVIGENCVAKGATSLATGESTNATGANSATFGQDTEASAGNAVAFGKGTKADWSEQFAAGKYNEPNSDDLFQIGYGAADDARKNIFAVDKTGMIKRNDRPFFVVDTVSWSATIPASQTNDFDHTISKNGYTPIGMAGFDLNGSGIAGCRVIAAKVTSGKAFFQIRNDSSNNISATFFMDVLYMAN